MNINSLHEKFLHYQECVEECRNDILKHLKSIAPCEGLGWQLNEITDENGDSVPQNAASTYFSFNTLPHWKHHAFLYCFQSNEYFCTITSNGHARELITFKSEEEFKSFFKKEITMNNFK